MKRRNLTLIISCVICIVLGIIALVTAYVLAGADVIAWLTSKWAITIYIFVGVYAFIVLMVLLNGWRKRL